MQIFYHQELARRRERAKFYTDWIEASDRDAERLTELAIFHPQDSGENVWLRISMCKSTSIQMRRAYDDNAMEIEKLRRRLAELN